MESSSDRPFAELTRRILGSAICVHRQLGPGLLESTYRACLVGQLELDGFGVRSEVAIPIRYAGSQFESGYRADLVVEGKVLVELKAVERLLPIHEAQTLTYLRHSNLPVGLLINFNVIQLTRGIRRFARTASDRIQSPLPMRPFP